MSTTVRRPSPSVRDGHPDSAKAVLCARTGGIPPRHELAVGNASLPRGQWRPQGRQSTCLITPLAAVLLAASQDLTNRLQYVLQKRKRLSRLSPCTARGVDGPTPDGELGLLAKAQGGATSTAGTRESYGALLLGAEEQGRSGLAWVPIPHTVPIPHAVPIPHKGADSAIWCLFVHESKFRP